MALMDIFFIFVWPRGNLLQSYYSAWPESCLISLTFGTWSKAKEADFSVSCLIATILFDGIIVQTPIRVFFLRELCSNKNPVQIQSWPALFSHLFCVSWV